MRYPKTYLLLTVALAFSSCWQKDTPISFVRPVKIAQAAPLDYYEKDFVGVVNAEQYTNLAFQVGGLINKMYVTDGSYVKKGQLLAVLEPQDFDLQLESDKAQYQSTQSILARNERLLSRQAISVQDVEISRANFTKSKSAYEYARNQVDYTKMVAPFSGSIEQKFVEDYQKVNAGEKVFRLINPDRIEVKFTLPETDVNITVANTVYSIEFENIPDKSFKAEIKEVVDASVNGMGIPVTLKITDPQFDAIKYNIKSGFACRVKVLIENNNKVMRSMVKVPITAIFSEQTNPNEKFVWIYDAGSSNVKKRKITTNGLVGSDQVIISQGLSANDAVVVAGVYQLIDNQKVTLLK